MRAEITPNELESLSRLLRERLAVIGDHEMRAEPERHLRELQRVSEALEAAHARLRERLPVRLEHFMRQGSYEKALAYIDATRSAQS